MSSAVVPRSNPSAILLLIDRLARWTWSRRSPLPQNDRSSTSANTSAATSCAAFQTGRSSNRSYVIVPPGELKSDAISDLTFDMSNLGFQVVHVKSEI